MVSSCAVARKALQSVAALTVAIVPLCGLAQTSVSAPPDSKCVKSIRWSSSLAPAERSEDGIAHSQDTEIAAEVLRRMGCTARFADMPWARALIELELGRLDVLPGAFLTPERQKYAHFSHPYIRSTNILFIRTVDAGKYAFQNLTDIAESDIRIGLQVGASYGKTFDTLRKNPLFEKHLLEMPARENAWKMLRLGRITGLIADDYIGNKEIRELGLQDTLQATKLALPDEFSMYALSKKTSDADFLRRFDLALNDMMADGTYRKIRERYMACQISVSRLGCR